MTSSTPAPILNESVGYTRLHITPLNPNLLSTIIPPSILPHARSISYHSLQTFPEKAYGFVELPIMDAEKIKKKLHGSILKGTKVRIETARPAKDQIHAEDPEYPIKAKKERKDPSKKRKRGEETIPAVELRDRRIKRGWTTPSVATGKTRKDQKDSKKAVVKSKYTTGPECLFKTVLPSNVAAKAQAKAQANTPNAPAGGNSRKRTAKDTVVHEFSKSTKYATFLRGPATSTKAKGVAEFVEGQGWVDEDGNVVEEVVTKTRRQIAPQRQSTPKVEQDPTGTALIEEESSSEEDSVENLQIEAEDKVNSSSADLESSEEELEDDVDEVSKKAGSVSAGSELSDEDQSKDATSESSGEDTESVAGSSTEEPEQTIEKETPKQSNMGPLQTPSITIESPKASRPQSSSGLSIKIPSSNIITTKSVATEVHPLEALYKKPKPDSNDSLPKLAPISFSFFGPDDEDVEEGKEAIENKLPLTPFTQREFEHRGLRSAAPTPDTAHANKRFVWPSKNGVDEEDEPASSPTREKSTMDDGKEETAPESDFGKWFYEHRGDSTRAWKKRRKTVAKEQRQRENRKRQNN